MEDKRTKKEESSTYFEERIAHIHEIRMSGDSVINKINSLISIADDYNNKSNRSFHLESDGIYDLTLLCDTMINMAESQMLAHEVMVMGEFHDFVERFRKNTQAQNYPSAVAPGFTIGCRALKDQIDALMSKYSTIEKDLQQKDHYYECLVRALCSIEQIDKEKRNLEHEMSNKQKKTEERVLMSLIEIAKNKPLSTRQGLKSLLQDYVNKNKVSISSSDFPQKLSALDDEQPDPKVVNVSNGGQYNDIHDNTTVNQK
jgi:hypothetical protein